MQKNAAAPSVLALALVASACGSRMPIVRPDASGDALGVTRVVLFQHGLGQFERRGTLHGSTVDLRVRSEHLDDVLRSLTVVDRAGAQVSSVRLLPGPRSAATSTLRIGFSTDGAHDVSISYVAVVPGWKPTYRLVARRDGHVRIQGLAVVDNHTGEPWEGISLVLSTDVPLSFEYALRARRTFHRPRFGPDGRLIVDEEAEAERDDSRLPDVQAAYAAARREEPEPSNRAGVMVGAQRDVPGARLRQGPRTGARSGAPSAEPSPPPATEPPRPDSALAAIEGHEGQPSFTLESGSRFTLGMGESGLVPFVDREATGGLVLLYKPAPGGGRSQSHPFRAVMFQNPTDAPLLTGPVTFYSERAYLGDGVTATIPGNAHAFVAYGMEPSVVVAEETERAEDEVRAVALHGGVLEVEVRRIVRRRFDTAGTRSASERLYVFAAGEPGFDPRDLPTGTVTTPAGYFLPAAVPGRTTLDLARRTTSQANVAADPRHPYVGALLALLGPQPEHRATMQRLEQIVARLEELRQQQIHWEEDLRVQQSALAEQRGALDALRDVPANGALRRQIGAGVARLVAAVDTASRHAVEANAQALGLRQEWYATLRVLTVRSDAAR